MLLFRALDAPRRKIQDLTRRPLARPLAGDALLPRIEGRIQLLRGLRVMIDADLASLYGVPTKALNQAVKRNADRFPTDFMFQLDAAEKLQVFYRL